MSNKKIINTTIGNNVDTELVLNTGNYNGVSKISIENQDNKCTFKMNTCSMVLGEDLLKSLEEILDYVKNNVHKDRYYTHGELIAYFLQALLQNNMCMDEDLYKTLDTWYWGDDENDCGQEDD